MVRSRPTLVGVGPGAEHRRADAAGERWEAFARTDPQLYIDPTLGRNVDAEQFIEGTELTAGVHFCPQCRFQVAPVCGHCFRGVQITDAYCPQCGHDVVEDRAPARLRAYSD